MIKKDATSHSFCCVGLHVWFLLNLPMICYRLRGPLDIKL
jgi:hypothetical protein